MLQFSSDRTDWRLDVVSILAILGESNIKLNAHLITSTRLCYLPRLSEFVSFKWLAGWLLVFMGNHRQGE